MQSMSFNQLMFPKKRGVEVCERGKKVGVRGREGRRSDVVAADSRFKQRHSSHKAKCSPESLHRVNLSRARQAVEDGEYRKAMQYLTSGGLAQVSTDVVNEMVLKNTRVQLHPRFPLIPYLPQWK